MLRFCFGASGAGKSTGLYKEIIDRSNTDPATDYLIIVPDQFTMQTQKDVVRMHPKRAIMNIDVLSFGRLSHRVFEETGHGSFSVLDDVGKSLVLRHVAEMLGDRLPFLGPNMKKSGYIDEVKSTISEFMMYGIGDEELALLEEKSLRKGALSSKLKDLRLLYSEFLRYIEGKYITTEETLDILCSVLNESKLIRDSVIVFDGFTGFTPIQYKVIKKLLELSREVIVSVTISPKEDPYDGNFGEQELFMLSKKTVRDLERLMFEVEKEQGSPCTDFAQYRELRHNLMGKEGSCGDIFYRDEPVVRHRDNAPLAYLESNLFRYNNGEFEGDNNSVFIYEASNLSTEVRQTMIKISNLVREEGYEYRDIALVCGSLESYAEEVMRQAERFDIPVYVDQNVNLLLNPMIEYITSALNIVIRGYRYEDVFHYMRSGLTGFDAADTDLLENYVRALGISGKKAWEDKFLRHMPEKYSRKNKSGKADEKELEKLSKLEGMRKKISEDLEGLFEAKDGTASDMVCALRTMIEENGSREKLIAYRESFEEKGDLKKAREYDQIYNKIMALLDQTQGLIGDEKLSTAELRDILMAGFGEISVGTIPQDVDRIIVGDIERTRLKEVRVLFFVGVNDGNIPGSAGSGGILSDVDRQFLMDLGTEVEFAPTPRQQMYIQRLYLYMNLTKPTDRLYLSFSLLSADGKSLHAAYLIPKLQKMFGNISIERPEEAPLREQLISKKDSVHSLSLLLSDYAAGRLKDESRNAMYTLLKVLSESGEKEFVAKLTETAFLHYRSEPLAKAVALSLYGATLQNSVSRLELFAGCAYSHFIRYGLRLDERQEYEFEVSDLGNVFHEVLEKYTGRIISEGIDWRTLSKEDSDRLLNQTLMACVDEYGNTILRSSARNSYLIERIGRILTRTVDTLKYQISKGSFNPEFVEMSFSEAGDIDEINVALSENEKKEITERMRLSGRVDRVDVFEDPQHVYVKVMDFKTGVHKFNLAYLYYGLHLQLFMYMNVASAVEKNLKSGKEVIPSAILYYHVDDPVVEASGEMVTDDINKEIISKLKMTGLVNDDSENIRLLDNSMNAKSDIIPVEYKKDGSLKSSSQTASLTEYRAISDYVNNKVKEFGRRILDGDIAVNPYEFGQSRSCTYCSYRSICGYDENIPGYEKRKLDMTDDEAKELIMSEYSKNVQ